MSSSLVRLGARPLARGLVQGAPTPLAGEGREGGASANLYRKCRHPHPFDSPPRRGEGRRATGPSRARGVI